MAAWVHSFIEGEREGERERERGRENMVHEEPDRTPIDTFLHVSCISVCVVCLWHHIFCALCLSHSLTLHVWTGHTSSFVLTCIQWREIKGGREVFFPPLTDYNKASPVWLTVTKPSFTPSPAGLLRQRGTHQSMAWSFTHPSSEEQVWRTRAGSLVIWRTSVP
jgi:hypothetical protein